MSKAQPAGLPENHVEIDWSNWSPAGPDDVRSPCPVINALANHHILPHSGKGITRETSIKALTTSLNLDPTIAKIFTAGAITTNPDHGANSFDFNHIAAHGVLEHDSSLSREDAAFGDQSAFSKEVFGRFLERYHEEIKARGQIAEDGTEMTSWAAASHVRYARLMESKAKHEEHNEHWGYGIKEAITSFGESCLYLSLLGKDGVAPLPWVRILFEEERLPYVEGWRPPAVINQTMLNHGAYEIIKANPHASEEVKLIGMGTLEALKTSIFSLGASLMKTPSPRPST